jgi:tagaturonate reductase
VFERFSNPFIKHALLSISLNSVSKYKARVLPSLEKFVTIHGKVPPCLTFGLAALIAFYRGTEIRGLSLIGLRDGKEYQVKDDLAILETFSHLWSNCDGSPQAVAALTDNILMRSEWWGRDLREISGLSAAVTAYLIAILKNGMAAAIAQVG